MASASENGFDAQVVRIRAQILLLQACRRNRVSSSEISKTAKTPFKAAHYRESLIWRMTELSEEALLCLERRRVVAGILLTRASLETTAALFFLASKIESAVSSKAVADIDDEMMKLVMGSRSIPELPEPFNVLKFVDSAEKKVQGFRRGYERLCEFAHPNWAGTTYFYSKPDESDRARDFGSCVREDDSALLLSLKYLEASLLMFQEGYTRVANILPSLVSLCEDRESIK